MQLADDGAKPHASQALLHRPERAARIAGLDMDEFAGAKARRMQSPGLADRHAVLHPEQGFVRLKLRQQEARPAAIAR